MKPNFKLMTRAELRAYVLQHREDSEAFQVLLSRRTSDAEATWYNFPNTEEGQQQTKEILQRKINGEL